MKAEKEDLKNSQPKEEQPVAQNPNPRANENIRTEEEPSSPQRTTGPGTEITDSEAG